MRRKTQRVILCLALGWAAASLAAEAEGIPIHPAGAGAADSALPPLSVASAARLQGAVRKAQKRFVEQVALITGVPLAKVHAMAPTDWRAGEPRFALIPALEKELGQRLSDSQRQKIALADRDMKAEISQARAVASDK